MPRDRKDMHWTQEIKALQKDGAERGSKLSNGTNQTKMPYMSTHRQLVSKGGVILNVSGICFTLKLVALMLQQ